MIVDRQEVAAARLADCVGKYISIFHKFNINNLEFTHSEDVCIVKVLSVTRAQFLSSPKIKVQFSNGKTAELSYRPGYKKEIMLNWDYQRYGRRYNNQFITWNDDGWDYTYPEGDNAIIDYFLATGDLFVSFFDSDEEAFEEIDLYTEALKDVEYKHDVATPKTTPIQANSNVQMDRVYLARA